MNVVTAGDRQGSSQRRREKRVYAMEARVIWRTASRTEVERVRR